MDKKTLIATAAATVVTLLTTMIVGWFVGVFERGSDAISEDQIEAVIQRVLVTDTGDTHAAALAQVNGTLIEIHTKVGIIQTDVDQLETAVRELASQ